MQQIIINRFASKRTLREGSVGLLILLGLGAFIVIILWLNRLTIGANSYKFIVEFANAGGMQKGAAVRYRGVKVGSIAQVKAGSNAVEVEIEVSPPNLLISRDVVIEANQSGLISESIIDMTPKTPVPLGRVMALPLDPNCDRRLIICNGDRLQGEIGISVDELIRSSTNLANTYNDPEFYQKLTLLLESSTKAANNVASLSKEVETLTKSFKQEIKVFSDTAKTVQTATNDLTTSSSETLAEFNTTAKQANRLLANLDELVTSNRSSVISSLKNISETSNQLRATVSSLSPTVNRLTQSELMTNLETLSANAAAASANLREASENVRGAAVSLNDPKNILLIQQTLDSARVTFENTQKITSDLDELTGDPAFRENLRQLVNGLSNLLSSAEQIEQQVKIAGNLDSMKSIVKQQEVNKLGVSVSPPKLLKQLREYREQVETGN